MNSVLSDYVLGADPSYFHQLPFRKKLEWIGAASIPQTAKRLRVSDEAQTEYEAKSRTVTSANLDDRGDFVGNAKADQGDARRLQVEQVGPMLLAPQLNAARLP